MIDRRAMLAATGAAAAMAGAARAAPFRRRDLEGTWTLATYTEIERPKEAAGLVMTEAEARAYEAPRRQFSGMLPSKPGEVGQTESEFTDRGDGLARVHGQIRSSWIIDPSDGQIPYRPDFVASRELAVTPRPEHLDNPEDRPGNERCIGNMATGAPMLGGADANLFQIVQAPGCVVILTERYHDARIVRLDGAGPPPSLWGSAPPSYMGQSQGRWDGDALVVETTGLRPGVTHRGGRLYVSGETRVMERFTRTGPAELFYEFTVEDPSLFTRPWRGEMVLPAAKGRLFEYACHEGNYSLPGILAGARLEEREAAAAKGGK